MTHQDVLVPALFGSATQEVIYWYSLRRKLDEPIYKAMMRSPPYWVITILMIVVSGFGTTYLFGTGIGSGQVAYLLGAGFPLVFKKLVEVTKARVDLGNSSSWRDYFS